jgi:enoyl-CoA hydratase/carnithine racemase
MNIKNIKVSNISNNIQLIQLNRSRQYNALNKELSDELVFVLQQADNNPKIKCIILTGEENFSAGADIKELANNPKFPEIWENIEKIKKPIVAAVQGVASGGGCEILMMCDIIISSEDAKFSQPEIKLGIICGGGATQRLPKIIGKNNAMEICLTGRTFSAQEAKELGLVNRITNSDNLMELTTQIAQEISQKPLDSIIATKELIKKSIWLSIEEGLSYEKKLFYKLLSSEDGKEGLSAFLEKRKPNFKINK